MLNKRTILLLLGACCILLPGVAAQCQMEGVPIWQIPQSISILDVAQGEIYRRTTTNVLSITSAQHNNDDNLNGGPYFEAQHINNEFTISLSDNFADYEEYEYVYSFNIRVEFSCTGGNNGLTFTINIQDTNNNAPRFLPSNDYTFSIAPPIVPGYEITSCYGNIIARDIDLSTERIIFAIEDNPYFEIEYGGADPSDSKHFFAVLRAIAVIRSLDEPLVLQINATDVDGTNDPQLTSNAIIRIEADDQFALPSEPVFSRPFYTATYNADDTLTVEQVISLAEGYDEEVIFRLTGEQVDYFTMTWQENIVTIEISDQLPAAILQENTHITLVVGAMREYTSGDTAAIVVQLPEAVNLQFEQISYEGVVDDGALLLSPLILSDGYSSETTASVVGVYSPYFTTQVTSNVITVSMSALPENIILENNFINILVEAVSGTSTASAVVTLEIIKDDIMTPVFEQDFYSGSYGGSELVISTISLSQGYDDTVIFGIQGDAGQYFNLSQNGNAVTLGLETPLPDDLVTNEQQLLFSVRASKPGTVGASTAISISLPSERILNFESDSYLGILEGNILELNSIILAEGYQNDVVFTLSGDFSTSFLVSNEEDTVTIALENPLTEQEIAANDILIITLSATGVNAIPTKTTIILQIIKDDLLTPVFSERIYNGVYTESHTIDIENSIELTQGYDETVSFDLNGENSQYFNLVDIGDSLSLVITNPLPEDLMEINNYLVFSVVASKPGTVGGHSTVSLTLPQARNLRFQQNSYIGSLELDELTLPSIILSEGYRDDLTFNLTGDYADYFTTTNIDNSVTIEIVTSLPSDIIDANAFIILILEASGPSASLTRTVVTIEIIKEDIATPVFSQYVYTGVYNGLDDLVMDEIYLSQGYDDTVTFAIHGEEGELFAIQQNGNSVILQVVSPIPGDVPGNSRLVFTVVANKAGAVSANAAVSIQVPSADDVILTRFDQSSYVGSIEEYILQLQSIILIEGYSETIEFNISGEYSNYFAVTNVGNVVSIQLANGLPQQVVDDNKFIVLELEAISLQAASAYTAIIIDIVNDGGIVPVFSQTYYTGTYTEEAGLIFEDLISLTQGYANDVTFELAGADAQWFTLQQNGNSVTISTSSPIPSAVLANEQFILFSVMANKPGTVGASSAISISLPEDLAAATVLRFEQSSYLGNVESDIVQLSPITLAYGYQDGVMFAISGVLAEYFTFSNVDNIVTISLSSSLPQELIENNRLITIELDASGPQAISAQTAIILEIIKDDNIVVPVFSEPFYTGTYTEVAGLIFERTISLMHGFDDTVNFQLEGENAIWFELQQDGNTATLSLSAPIPSAVLANNLHLLFTVIATKPGTVGGSTAISILLPDDLGSATILRFEQSTYLGNVQSDILQLSSITLSYGYQDGVIFALSGEFAEYFTFSNVDNIVTLLLSTSLPQEVIENNRLIIIELDASGPQAISAQTAIILEIIKDDDNVVPVFSEPFYTGTYTEVAGLIFERTISLVHGFDETVNFQLEGEDAIWFELQQDGNTATLSLSVPIPSAVLANNLHLLFTVIATKPGTVGGSTAISILLPDDLGSATILRFEQSTYLGNVQSDILQLSSITLSYGYQDGVIFALSGEFAEYFTFSNVDNIVTLLLSTSLPQEVIENNRLIIIELDASGPQAISAQTAIILEIIKDDDNVVPVFSEPFYTGTYTEVAGLIFERTISLVHGFDETVNFQLEGEDAIWFELQQDGNTATLSLSVPIPSAVLANNLHLLFTVIATKPGTVGGSTAISILLPDDLGSATILRFEQSTYLGNVQSDILQLSPITLSYDYQDGVIFALSGEFAEYFTFSNVDNIVTLLLSTSLPQEIIEHNSLIIIELDASGPQAVSAQTAIILEIIKDDNIVVPVFSEPFYTGTYTEVAGLIFERTISLVHGFDDTVNFQLEGENAIWFELQQDGNTATLSLSAPIPSAVLANNLQLLFTVIANKPGTVGGSTAISILIPDDLGSATILRFEQSTYLGNVQRDILQLSSITLSYGYQDGVIFALSGEFAEYFTFSNVDNIVTLLLSTSLPQEVIENNRLIIIEMDASGPQAISAQTAIILEIIKDDDNVVPVFSEPFYTGTYTEVAGLIFERTISLVHGFDETVNFQLEGEDAIWFELQQDGNTATLSLSVPIPSAVLANNLHLLFTVIATKPGTVGGSTAISILLPDDLGSATILRFEQSTYLGNVQSDILQLSPITLSYGYQDGVIFALSGEFAEYFTFSNVDNIVTLLLSTSLPQEIIENNSLIIIELDASGPQAISAQTAIILEIIKDDNIIVPVFSEPFYTGTYTEVAGLIFERTISLVHGFDETVNFQLEGEDAIWFELQQDGNTATLSLSVPIPSAVLANNLHLLFTVIATKPGTVGGSTAISILLPDDLGSATILRFEQSTYLGNVQSDILQLSPITLSYGYQDGVIFALSGEFAEYFTFSNVDNIVTLLLSTSLPQEIIENNSLIIIELDASGPQAISAQTAIILEIIKDDNIVVPVFSEPFYTGTYTEVAGLIFERTISLVHGFDDTVNFQLEGENAIWFELQQDGNTATLSLSAPIPSAVLANNLHLLFTVIATKPGTVGGSTAISILLPDDLTTATILRFEQSTYVGNIQSDILQLSPITLAYGYNDGVLFTVSGEFADYFTFSNVDNVVTLFLSSSLPEEITEDNIFIILELDASGLQVISAQTAIILELIKENYIPVPVFSEPFYTGIYTEVAGLTFERAISLVHGFDDTVIFQLDGSDAQWFSIQQNGNEATLTIATPIPSAVLANNYHILFSVIAYKSGTINGTSAISISFPDDGSETGVYFERALYLGFFELGVTSHDPIALIGYSGSTVQLFGDYGSQFSAVHTDGAVTIRADDGAIIPPDVTHLAFELEAAAATTALVITVRGTEPAVDPPTVEFMPASYVIRTDVAQTGLIGRVNAVADNGETLLYTLLIDSEHLQERLSITNEGDLLLSAPATSGVYQFVVTATTIATQISADAAIRLTVETIITCGSDNRVLPPLIVIERDEEEPHDDLVLLNENLSTDCSYDFTYRWPFDRDWLYINETTGHLSARVIDREDPAIAFMTLSQVQIELILNCNDVNIRSKRDTYQGYENYDYGNNQWILTDGINYNSRRSFVNLIVNDINDNPPIFIGKDNEPIVVGYPVADLLDAVAPTSLVTLQATDADIGENAQLIYWSDAPELAVSRQTGAVHVRDNAARALQSGATFVVYATDRSGGEGSLTGDISITIRILELHHIAVLTVRNALLEDEDTIIQQMRTAVNHEVKTLRATVISDEYDVESLSLMISTDGNINSNNKNVNKHDISRTKRQTETVESGASLRLFVYGLIDSQPIEASQLISNIENAELAVEWTASYEVLEEHLDTVTNGIVPGGPGNGLLISTIILSILLVLIIVFVIAWYLIKIRKNYNYEQFSDTTSEISNQNSFDPPPKVEEMTRPRPNIQEIKRTEQRLQEMLEQPVPLQEAVQNGVEIQSTRNVRFDTISEIPTQEKQIPSTDIQLPMVIQSIDKLNDVEVSEDDDEFGEKKSPRKSVVTFNENVERIIHVDNIAEENESSDGVEVYRL